MSRRQIPTYAVHNMPREIQLRDQRNNHRYNGRLSHQGRIPGTANTISAVLLLSRLHSPYDVPQDARNRAPGTIFESGHLPITRQARIATHCGAAPAADEYDN